MGDSSLLSYKRLVNDESPMSPIPEGESNISLRRQTHSRASFSNISDISKIVNTHALIQQLFDDPNLISVRSFLREMDDVLLFIPFQSPSSSSSSLFSESLWSADDYMRHIALSKLTRPTHIITTSGRRILLEWNDVAYLVGTCENSFLKDWKLLKNTASIPDSAWSEFDSLSSISAKGIPLYSRDPCAVSRLSGHDSRLLSVRILLMAEDFEEPMNKSSLPDSLNASTTEASGTNMPVPAPSKQPPTSSTSPQKLVPTSSRSALFALSSTMIESLGSIQVIPSFFGRAEVVLPPIPTSEFSDLESVEAFMVSINRPGRSVLISDIQKTISDLNNSVSLMLSTPATVTEKAVGEISSKYRKEMQRLKTVFQKPAFDENQKDFDELATEGLEMYCLAKLYPGLIQLVDLISKEANDQVDTRLSTLGFLSLGTEEIQKVLGMSFVSDLHKNFLHKVGADVMVFSTTKIPTTMLETVLQIHYAIAEFAKNEDSESTGSEQSADSLLHLLVQLLIRISPRNLHRQMTYIKAFFDGNIDGHAEYCLVNFEAAICFIRSVKLSSLEISPCILDACGPPLLGDTFRSSTSLSLTDISRSSHLQQQLTTVNSSNDPPSLDVSINRTDSTLQTKSASSPSVQASLFSRINKIITSSTIPSTVLVSGIDNFRQDQSTIDAVNPTSPPGSDHSSTLSSIATSIQNNGMHESEHTAEHSRPRQNSSTYADEFRNRLRERTRKETELIELYKNNPFMRRKL